MTLTVVLIKLAWLFGIWLSGFLAGRWSVRRAEHRTIRQVYLRGFSKGYGECIDDANEAVRQRDRELAERN